LAKEGEEEEEGGNIAAEEEEEEANPAMPLLICGRNRNVIRTISHSLEESERIRRHRRHFTLRWCGKSKRRRRGKTSSSTSSKTLDLLFQFLQIRRWQVVKEMKTIVMLFILDIRESYLS